MQLVVVVVVVLLHQRGVGVSFDNMAAFKEKKR